MKRLLIILLSFGFILGANYICYHKNVFADGIEPEENLPSKINITYIEYSISDENKNVVKNIKQGKLIISDDNMTFAPQEPIQNNAYYEQDNDIYKTELNNLQNDEDYKIHQLAQPNYKNQNPNKKKPRPIMPIIDTDIFNMYFN